MPLAIDLSLDESGMSGSVRINGIDISNHVQDVSVKGESGVLTTVTLTLNNITINKKDALIENRL